MLILGDCMEKMREMPENSIDAVVTDPPYGWRFMGKAWDGADIQRRYKEELSRPDREPKPGATGRDKYPRKRGDRALVAGSYDFSVLGNEAFEHWTYLWAREAFRVLKPGGHMLVFCGPRTYHRMASGVEDAGFEIRDCLSWIFGSGFPKNLDVRKAGIKAGLLCGCNEISKHNMRSVSETDLPSEIDTSNECEKTLQHGLSEQNLSEQGTQGREAIQREEPLLEGRQLCGTSEGLPIVANAGTPESAEKRVCIGAHSSSREDVGKATEEERSGPSHQSQTSGQSSGKPQSISKSQRTLDGTPSKRCEKCSKAILPEGTGTALKPAAEFIVLARKPLSEKTVAQNVLKWGTGGLNIDGCRIEGKPRTTHTNGNVVTCEAESGRLKGKKPHGPLPGPQGRFPSNLILDEVAAEMLDFSVGNNVSRFFKVCGRENIKADDTSVGRKAESKNENLSIDGCGKTTSEQYHLTIMSITGTKTHSIMTFQIWNASTKACTGFCTIASEKSIELLTELNIESVNVASNTEASINLVNGNQVHIKGTVSLVLVNDLPNGERKIKSTGTLITENIGSGLRFVYCAKASRSERNRGLESREPETVNDGRNTPIDNPFQRGETERLNVHPTVKPIKLMRYLCRLVTPPNGTVLDPFMGSGSTGIASKEEGFEFIGIELDKSYFDIAERRINIL